MKKSAIALLMLTSAFANAYTTETVYIKSNEIKGKHEAVVVLPDSYDGKKSYSVVYVLHGWSGDEKSWTDKTSIAKQADVHDLILVMPHGDYDK